MIRDLCLAFLLLILSVTAHSAEPTDMPSPIGDGTLRRIHTPILMYHYVSPLPPNADRIRVGLTLSPALFNQHLAYFAENGYETVSLYDLDDALSFGQPLPNKSVILTFDDGYSDHYEIVYPSLKERGFSGTFFVITAFADHNRPGHLTWPQIIEMQSGGMSMESHTKDHSELDDRQYDFLVYQILGSLESLEAYLGHPTRMFSYPVGRYDAVTLSVMDTTPVLRAVTTQSGALHTTDNRYELPRMRVSNETGVSGLIQLLGK